MAVSKLSQIADASSPPALTDTLVGVGGGTTDYQYTLQQVSLLVNENSILYVGANLVEAPSGQFSNATYWAPLNVLTITDNTVAAPDGTITASTIADSATNNSFGLTPAENVNVSSGTVYTASIYAKAGTATFIQLSMDDSSFSGDGYIDVNLTTGVISSTGGTLTGYGVQAASNGWYRIWVTATASANTVFGGPYFFLINNNGNATRKPTYTGTGEYCYIWQAEFVIGAGTNPATVISGGINGGILFDSGPGNLAENPGFYFDGANLNITNANTISNGITLVNTSSGGQGYYFFSTGQDNGPGKFGVYDGTAGASWLVIDGTDNGNFIVAATAAFSWSSASSGFGPPDTGLYRLSAGVLSVGAANSTYTNFAYNYFYTPSAYCNTLTLVNASVLVTTQATFTNGAGTSLGTLTNAPSAGNPTSWIAIDDNGTTRYIPAW
jgi:hypothetical protein